MSNQGFLVESSLEKSTDGNFLIKAVAKAKKGRNEGWSEEELLQKKRIKKERKEEKEKGREDKRKSCQEKKIFQSGQDRARESEGG
ncbi:hypothetical protein RUM43_012753 [Polyplax serrata]|uniref:Uncharacterized protein n=1 Tax=Polyplax serrata TaxID=468196 RepID=A0AAN8Q343_POLSC